ncbi:MAG: hypothetical protein AB7O43_15135 [Hyphomicrobiaceae bacterium]
MTDDKERRRAYFREYRRQRRAAGLDGMGNEKVVIPVEMIRGPWVQESNGVMSRELRGV